ncbi:hypothetical protein BpHYR1_048488 [Brachionus plicatilis]|uniref:Uncharacterized protein n=1 Tax=Brachionus plicatilis TaxID=10195 RepID=A0A3M7QU88_BRAPC|nr:hypothetical protein BpHYR1_048488 [Brachionus plicatilis]
MSDQTSSRQGLLKINSNENFLLIKSDKWPKRLVRTGFCPKTGPQNLRIFNRLIILNLIFSTNSTFVSKFFAYVIPLMSFLNIEN